MIADIELLTADDWEVLGALEENEGLIRASICQASFWEFCKEFWEEVPGAGKMIYNWHMEFLAQELQVMALRVYQWLPKLYDEVFNVPFGTSKSTICSILFQPWTWTFMPWCRHLTASHTDSLVLDLSNKSRQVIKSEKYQLWYPEIQLRDDQDTKGYFANTLGGDRLTCTVGGKSPVGFHGHLLGCFPWEASVITDHGILPIGKIVDEELSARLLGYDHTHGKLRWQTIEAWESNPGRCLCKIVFTDGSFVESTEDHPIFVEGRGYIPAIEVETRDEVISVQKMQEVWEGNRSHERNEVEKEQYSLQRRMCSRCSERQGIDTKEALQVLWETNRRENEQMGFLLQSGMQSQRDEWEESPSVLQHSKALLALQKDHVSSERKQSPILQCQMSRQDSTRKQSLQIQPTESELQLLWNRDLPFSFPPIEEQTLLLKGLCKQRALRKNVRTREFKLHLRQWTRSLLTGVRENSQADQKAGWLLLCSMQKNRARKSSKTRCASCRLEQRKQRSREFGEFVQRMPYQSSGWVGKKSSTSKKTVAFVERTIRIPDKVYNLSTVENHNYFANGILVHNCDDPTDPKKVLSVAEAKTARDFITNVLPTRKVDKAVSTMFMVMQRLGVGDPTDVMLELTQIEGAAALRHVLLPGEVSSEKDKANVKPPELLARYTEDGLMDPHRLSWQVLKEYKAKGEHFYATQILQRPYTVGGGMFREDYFNQRCRASPYHAKRVRYWDRASSEESSACYTAGVLMARGEDGNYYVEDVVKGQWEPDERNRRMRACALKDRQRYGPNDEPDIWIEAEGGASGKDAFKGTARALAGFSVREQRVSGLGSKEVRAEPWSSQCAAKNVFLVDDGLKSWDINGYIAEHCAFPRAPLKDMVDSSAGAFSILVNARVPQGIHVYRSGGKKGLLKLLVCSKDELASTIIDDHPSLLVSFQEPLPLEVSSNGEMIQVRSSLPSGGMPVAIHESNRGGLSSLLPLHALGKLQDSLILHFADLNPADHQQDWEHLLPPWDRKPAELVLDQAQGKRLWSFLTRKRSLPIEVMVFQDEGEDCGDRRALSTAYAVCDTLGLKRSETIYRIGKEEDKHDGKASNEHVYEMVRRCRGLVV